jgi:hypothetical protein
MARTHERVREMHRHMRAKEEVSGVTNWRRRQGSGGEDVTAILRGSEESLHIDAQMQWIRSHKRQKSLKKTIE